jgi:uncharacterized protein (TIGR02611 family)
MLYFIYHAGRTLYTADMGRFAHTWRKVPAAVRKPLIFVVGFAIVAAGLALLVLPGPGWAAIFLGFAILATEFAFAEKVRNWLVDQLKKLAHAAKRNFDKLRHHKP